MPRRHDNVLRMQNGHDRGAADLLLLRMRRQTFDQIGDILNVIGDFI